MNLNTCVAIGRIVGVHGIKGYVKVHCEADFFLVLANGHSVIVRDPKGASHELKIVDSRPHGRILLLLLNGIFDRTTAEMLRGSDLLLEKSSLPELEPDTYYWMDGELKIIGDTAGTDIQALADGFVSLTPIWFDLTHTAVLPKLRDWNLTL